MQINLVSREDRTAISQNIRNRSAMWFKDYIHRCLSQNPTKTNLKKYLHLFFCCDLVNDQDTETTQYPVT